MRKPMRCILFLIFASVSCHAQNIPAISGWSYKEQPLFTLLSHEEGAGKYLAYQVNKPGSSTQTANEWFTAAVSADVAKEQWKESGKGALEPAGICLVYLTQVADNASQKWYVCYIGYQFDNKQNRLARIKSTMEVDFFKTNTTIATKHFARIAAEDQKTAMNNNERPAPATPTATKPKPAPPVVKTPGTGVKPEQLHSVIMHLEYEVGMGGGIFPVYNPYVLFKNGSIYKYPFYCMEDLDEKASRLSEPKKWGSWKFDNDKLVLIWPAETPRNQNETWDRNSYYNVVAAKKSEPIDGNFKSISGGGNTALGGDVMVFAADNIAMNPDGRFSLARVAGVNSGRDFWENNSGKSDESGTYKLDGYAIELKYNNGKTERRFFYFYPDSKKHFGIGYSVYMPKR